MPTTNKKKQKNSYSSDMLKAYLDANLTEYNQLRNEIVEFVTQKATATNYSLIITAALITFLPQAIKDFGEFVLLLAPIPFWGLIWYVITTDNLISRNSSYIKWVLAPNINKILNDQFKDSPELQHTVLRWEEYASFPHETLKQTVARGVISSGRQILLFLPIMFCVGIFIYSTRIAFPRAWNLPEIYLLITNFICLIWFITIALLVARQFKTKPKSFH